MANLADILDRLTVEGELYEKLEDNALRCFACAHRCLIRQENAASARCASTGMASCMCPGGMSPG